VNELAQQVTVGHGAYGVNEACSLDNNVSNLGSIDLEIQNNSRIAITESGYAKENDDINPRTHFRRGSSQQVLHSCHRPSTPRRQCAEGTQDFPA